jgi:FtsP/CotA-like multicopper oxidase with cupredoxin domain
MDVVEADDTPVYGPFVTHVQIAPAQRYSVIVNTNQGNPGQGFWMRTGTDTGASLMSAACTDEQDVLGTTCLQSGISSSFDMSMKGPRVMGKDLLRRLGKTYPRVKLISGMATTLPAPSASQ